MRYKNTKTGAIIDSSCIISGGDWVKETKPKTTKKVESKEVKPKKGGD